MIYSLTVGATNCAESQRYPFQNLTYISSPDAWQTLDSIYGYPDYYIPTFEGNENYMIMFGQTAQFVFTSTTAPVTSIPFDVMGMGPPNSNYHCLVGAISFPTATPTASTCPWDLIKTGTSNGKVDAADLAEVNRCYSPLGGVATGCQAADFNNNGVVNALDYSILLTHWGNCPAN